MDAQARTHHRVAVASFKTLISRDYVSERVWLMVIVATQALAGCAGGDYARFDSSHEAHSPKSDAIKAAVNEG